MNQPIISVKNISKKYNITHQQGRYVALRDVLTNIARRPFSFLKHKAKAAISKITKEEFWALKDINFEVKKGEAIGIIGANGAGKSTLLKILTGITPPTTGKIVMRGKVASLLEVGTGFHPELTGRENIFLNGAILGMTKKEIAKKFDAIVEFSGVKKFIDTPVKRYSSGMMVRLGFSIAAHMEPDILLVDEVLAVGDAEFQKKCLGKMNEVTKKAGRTILFVSHNMAAVEQLCKKCILLEDGKVKMVGKTLEVVNYYLKRQEKPETVIHKKDESVELFNISLTDIENVKKTTFKTTEKIIITVEYKINDEDIKILPNIHLSCLDGTEILQSICPENKVTKKGFHMVQACIPANLLNNKTYRIWVALASFDPVFDHSTGEITFTCLNQSNSEDRMGFVGDYHGVIHPLIKWTIN